MIRTFLLYLNRFLFGSKLEQIRKQVNWRQPPKPRSLERGSISLRKAA